jgi:hypothetical protein
MWKRERDGDALLAEARSGEGGAASIDFATLGYGVATCHRSRGEDETARGPGAGLRQLARLRVHCGGSGPGV